VEKPATSNEEPAGSRHKDRRQKAEVKGSRLTTLEPGAKRRQKGKAGLNPSGYEL